jgi:outer membrane biosynthesis protein TonB
MTRRSPKALVLIAAVLTLALLAFVFAGAGSSGDRPPRDRLTDEQAKAPPGPARQLPDLSAIVAGNEETAQTTAPPPPPPPPPEPQADPVTQQSPVVRSAPTPPQRSAKTEARPVAESRPPPKAEVRKTTPKAVPTEERRAAPAKTPSAPAPPRIATVRPSYNCRYARTQSEVAVCGDAGLASLDRQMAGQFSTAYRQGTAAQREVLERSRLRFLYRRDRCQSASCIAATYRARMSEINDIAARNWREP